MRILLVGTPYDVHMGTFASYLSEVLPSVQIDLISVVGRIEGRPIPTTLNNIYFKQCHFPRFVYKIPKIQNVISALDFKKSFIKQIQGYYSFINIHYVSVENAFCYKAFRRVSEKIILTPYGSDIMRAPCYVLKLLRGLYQRADYVCGSGCKLTLTVKDFYKIPDEKIVNLSFGSILIDELNCPSITKCEAKNNIGVNGKTTITVGYNASKNQNHIQVIEQLGKLSESIKKDVVVLLPLTYPSDEYYISILKAELKQYNLKYVVFDKFLSLQQLLLIRMASDIFINAQITDASSASVKEYLLANNILLNASWLDYPLLEENGVPYVVFDSYEELSSLVNSALESIDDYLLPEPARIYLLQEGWKSKIKQWADFFNEKQ